MTEQVIELLNTLRMQMQDNQDTIKQVEENVTRKINDNINEKFCRVEEEINKINKIQAEQEYRLDNFDKILRQKNIIIFGITEEEEKYSDLEDIVIQMMIEKLGIDLEKKEIEFVGRVGKKENKLRPIRLTLSTLGKKIQILKQKKVLDGSGTYIKEDYPPKVLETRKGLQIQLNEQKEKGISSFLVYDKIIITEKPNNKRDLLNSPQENKIRTKDTNQKIKRAKISGLVFKPRSNKPLQESSSQSIKAYITRTPQREIKNKEETRVNLETQYQLQSTKHLDYEANTRSIPIRLVTAGELDRNPPVK